MCHVDRSRSSGSRSVHDRRKERHESLHRQGTPVSAWGAPPRAPGTVGQDGIPHVAPVGWAYNTEHESIDIGGHSLERTKKYRDVMKTGRAAIVIDDVLPPWQPRGIEVRGPAEVLDTPTPLIRIRPQRIVSWGIESDVIGEHVARTVDKTVP